MSKPLKIVIIGAGLAGIATALRLRKHGHAVMVLERSDDYGGKLGTLEWKGFRWDRGPSLFTEPDLVDELFTLYGENPREHFNYTSREMACTYFFPDRKAVHFYTDQERLKNELSEKFTPELAEKTIAYLKESRSVYQRIGTFFTDSPQPCLKDIFRKDLLVRYPQLFSSKLRQTLHVYNKRKLADRRLVQLFDRFGTYNGSDPFRMSGLYSMIPHLEHNDGTYFPEGGMRSIVDSLYRLAVKNGVEFRFGQHVWSAVKTNSSGYQIRSNGNKLMADKLVCAIDHLPFYRDILKDEKQYVRYQRYERSSSALVFYWAVDCIVPQSGLHAIFFSTDYKREFAEIFGSKTFPSEPTIYVHISSEANPFDAPEGCQNWFVMINTPSGIVPDSAQTAALRNLILRRIKKQLEISLEEYILFEKTWDAGGIEKNTGSEGGALYGASSNGKLAALKRHSNKSRCYPNLYFCGGTVHPGGGIPLVLRSAKIVEKLVAHEAKVVAYFPLVLFLFHAIGLVLFIREPETAALSWLNILLSGTLVFIAENNLQKTAIAFAGIFVSGYVIELIGTQTGCLFGNYKYATSLGLKLLGVPVIIGVNWFVIIVASAHSARLFNMPILLQSGLAALLATLLDMLIEPVAMRYGFWSWEDDRIPVFNYICWFVFSLLFAYFYIRKSSERNRTAIALFVYWVLFFTFLNTI